MDGIFHADGRVGRAFARLGLLLVYNTINTIIPGQVDQIGIMKAIGARTGQIISVFFRLVLSYGLLALLVALPLGILGGSASSLVSSFGADPGEFEIDPASVLVMAAIAVIAPLLASSCPSSSAPASPCAKPSAPTV